VTLSGSKIYNDAEHSLFTTAELVRQTVNNCHITWASSSLNFCTNIINSLLVRHYYGLDVVYQICFCNGL